MSSSERRRSSSYGITDDLLNLILVRLPVKFLLRCKAVCKPWCSLISSPEFTDSHFTRAITSPGADATLIARNQEDGSFSLLRLGPTLLVAELKFPFSQSEFPILPATELVGSAKGIVCVSVLLHKSSYCNECPANIYLWNPATRQSKLIPRSIVKYKSRVESCGFGYDPIDNDFKFVMVFGYPHPVEVYSVNMNVTRKVGGMPRNISIGDFSVCVDGFLCWNGEMGIVAFDLNREVFNCDTMFPDGLCNDGNNYLRISEFNYSVAVIKERGYDGKIKLWTLDNVECLRGSGGGVASWTLVLSINAADLPLPYVHRYFNSGDFLLKSKDGDWFSYDSNKKEAKKLPISVSIFPGQMFKFMESLVLIPGSRPVEWNVHEEEN